MISKEINMKRPTPIKSILKQLGKIEKDCRNLRGCIEALEYFAINDAQDLVSLIIAETCPKRAPTSISPRFNIPCTIEESHCHDDTGCIPEIIDCIQHYRGCYYSCHDEGGECACQNSEWKSKMIVYLKYRSSEETKFNRR